MPAAEHAIFEPLMRPLRLLPIRLVEDRTGRKKSFIYAGVLAGTFPAPRKLGRSSLWLESDIEKWIAEVVAGGMI